MGGLAPREAARRFSVGAEDAAHEFERSILGDPHALSGPGLGLRVKGKGREASKRPASGAVSDASSDLEIPNKNDRSGPASKKRKLDKHGSSVADDLERTYAADNASTSAIHKHSGSSKSKGKGRQTQRELSHDSVSVATPKSLRRRGGIRKKLGLAPELELELGSRAPSISGDATPTVSRPASPAPTSSAIVYEFDEQIPQLKKAKKVDDAAMLKRLKSLEESQRKVWTNIARRDAPKVKSIMIQARPSSSIFGPGVQISCTGLSDEAGTVRAPCKISLYPSP